MTPPESKALDAMVELAFECAEDRVCVGQAGRLLDELRALIEVRCLERKRAEQRERIRRVPENCKTRKRLRPVGDVRAVD